MEMTLLGPHTRDSNNVARFMWLLCIHLLPVFKHGDVQVMNTSPPPPPSLVRFERARVSNQNGYRELTSDKGKNFKFLSLKSRDSSVGIALGYGLNDRGSRVRFPAGVRNFPIHHRLQNGSTAHPTSYPMGTRGSLPVGKVAGAWSWTLPSN
jgi:hypothetical protein